MQRFFYPASIVVIGVSAKESNMARHIVYNCQKWQFPGDLYAVGPSGGSVYGVSIHRDLEEIPDGVELAVILTPAGIIPKLLETCGRKGIQRVVIESGGFGEYSAQAESLEAECLTIAQRYGMRLVGPNGIGIVHAPQGVVLPFTPFENRVPPGEVSVLTQSGGVGLHLIIELVRQGQGLDKLVSLGNKLDLDEVDFVEYLLEDPHTRVIALYLESLSRGRQLMELASRSDKPILVLKSNIGQAGAQAAQSHTKALSNDDVVVDAALRQAGMIRVLETADLVLGVKALRLPPMKGNRVAVVSRSGGHAILVADALERDGFDLVPYSSRVLEVAQEALRAAVIRMRNPLDVGDIFDFDAYLSILEAILEEDRHDGILFLHTYRIEPQRIMAKRLIEGIEQLVETYQKPISCCLITIPDELAAIRSRSDLPIFENPEDAAHALRMSRDYHGRVRQPFAAQTDLSTPIGQSSATNLQTLLQPTGWLPYPTCWQILEALALPICRWAVADSVDRAVQAADRMDQPVVLKVLSPDVLHKTEADGVRLNLKGADAVRQGYEALIQGVTKRYPTARLDGVLVQQQAPEGVEMIIGGRQDPTFGPIVLFGLGGVFSEVLRDVAIRVAPVDGTGAAQMIAEIKGARLLSGFRGRPAADCKALEEILVVVSDLLVNFPRVREIDLNPVRVYPGEAGALILDGRIRVAEL